MKRRAVILSIGIVLLLLLVVFAVLARRQQDTRVRAQLVGPTADATGFPRVEGPPKLTFPADYGPHSDYQTEWWYYTGNLRSATGQHFGYQLTIFRWALLPPDQRRTRQSNWAADQVYMAHFAIADVADKRYQAFERFSRGGLGLAGAQPAPYRVWLEDWSIEEVEPNVFRLRAAQDSLSLDLLLTDRKGPILQGDRGYSQKGPSPGNASAYVSQTRLESAGTVQVGGRSHRVDGLSWMDHEFSTSALGHDQVGWDWFALQLDDGGELMVFQIRKEDGSVDPFSSGTAIAPDGTTRHLARADFQIDVGATWRSPHSGATYPAQWTVSVPSQNLTLNMEPYLADQELQVSFDYWEGAVRITGQHAGRPVSGNGYVEMTGYAGSIQGQF